jgi:hypothetical protein
LQSFLLLLNVWTPSDGYSSHGPLVLNIKDINDEPTPFHVLIHTFSKCLNAELTLQGNSGKEVAMM